MNNIVALAYFFTAQVINHVSLINLIPTKMILNLIDSKIIKDPKPTIHLGKLYME